MLENHNLIALTIKHLQSSSLQVQQRCLHLLVTLALAAHHATSILADDALMQLFLAKLRDKEYSLAQGAAAFLHNLSYMFGKVKFTESLHLMYNGLVSLEQSDDIFMLNLKTLHNLLKSKINSQVVVDFVRRGILT